MTNKFIIEQGLFYITNVCNLTCHGCETFNNRKFKGHSTWEDYKQHYIEWSKKTEIDFITVIGGEPFSNPDLINWLTGLKAAWPNCKNMNICTNGTYLGANVSIIQKCIDLDIWLDISCHEPVLYNKIQNSLETILKDNNYDYTLTHENQTLKYYLNDQLIARIYTAYTFQQSSQKYIKDGVIHMHNSDIEKSHKLCTEKLGQCHSFVKGNLYKCYLTGISQDLTQQFQIENSAKELLNSYKYCSPFDSIENIDIFLKKIKNPIQQCKLCPEKVIVFPIWPLSKSKINYD
jgi:organic radical activating enzyme